METTLHIPWTNEALRALLLEIMQTGEATKIDFKSVWDIGSGTQKAELARDIQSLANSSDPAYQNHGFLVFGIVDGVLANVSFEQNADQMQATVDQIVQEYLGPFVQTHVRHFEDDGKQWGVIVVPPSRNAPHVFVRDSAKSSRGDVWVRVGTTSSKAAPADFARFFRIHLEDYGRVIWDELRDLRRDLDRLRERASPTITVAQPVAVTATGPAATTAEVAADQSPGSVDAIRRSLARAAHPVAQALETEATELRSFLESNELPWDTNLFTKENAPALIQRLEDESEELWKGLALVVEHDDEGRFDTEVVETLRAIAFIPSSPVGTAFTDGGTGIRLYPLTVAMYIIFAIGLRKKRYSLLTRIASLELASRSEYEDALPIATALFYVRRAREPFSMLRDDYPQQRWCDSIGVNARRWIASHLYPEHRAMERQASLLYVAEFVLSLLGAVAPNLSTPASGAFYFESASAPTIRRFLKDNGEVLRQLFGKDLRAALERFDEYGSQIAHSGNCWGDGFQRGATAILFPPEEAV